MRVWTMHERLGQVRTRSDVRDGMGTPERLPSSIVDVTISVLLLSAASIPRSFLIQQLEDYAMEG